MIEKIAKRVLEKLSAHQGAVRSLLGKIKAMDVPFFHHTMPATGLSIAKSRNIISAAEAEAHSSAANSVTNLKDMKYIAKLQGLVGEHGTGVNIKALESALKDGYVGSPTAIYGGNTPFHVYGPVGFVAPANPKTMTGALHKVTAPVREGGHIWHTAEAITANPIKSSGEQYSALDNFIGMIAPRKADLPKVQVSGGYYNPKDIVMGPDGKPTATGIALARQLKAQGLVPMNRRFRRGMHEMNHNLDPVVKMVNDGNTFSVRDANSLHQTTHSYNHPLYHNLTPINALLLAGVVDHFTGGYVGDYIARKAWNGVTSGASWVAKKLRNPRSAEAALSALPQTI